MQSMPAKYPFADSVFWRNLRKDFEELLGKQIIMRKEAVLEAHAVAPPARWEFDSPEDDTVRMRLSVLALRGAQARGGKSADEWFDLICEAEFAKASVKNLDAPLSEKQYLLSVELADVVEHSITQCYLFEALSEGAKRAEPDKVAEPQRAAGRNKAKPELQFPKRAAWLDARLLERGWNKHDLNGKGGPHHKTTQKILNGFDVQEDVLRKVVLGLNAYYDSNAQKLAKVKLTDIPRD
jgi:hypothetical protein